MGLARRSVEPAAAHSRSRALVLAPGISRSRERVGLQGLLGSAWRVALFAALVVGTAALFKAAHGGFLSDYRGDVYLTGRAIVAGHNPYDPALFMQPVLPAPVLIGFLPLTVLPFALGGVLFVLLSLAAAVAALWLLGVRDWRCYALALCAWPMLQGLFVGSASALLLFGAAVIWHWRDYVWPPVLALTSVVILKLFAWPLAFWALVTHRRRVVVLAVALGVLVTLAAWALIGFDGLTTYPKLLSSLDYVLRGSGPSLFSLLLGLGVAAGLAKLAVLGLAGGLVYMARRLVRGAGSGASEARAFGLIVMAALIASPHVFEHYLVLLFVPIALMSPGLSALWFVPVLAGVVPTPDPADIGQTAFWVGLQLIVVARLLLPGRVAARRQRVAAPASTAHAYS
jgi:hypothetical protein